MVQHLKHRSNSTRFGIGGTINQSRQSGVDHGPGAHGARLQGHIELAIEQSVIGRCISGGTQGNNFSMGSGIYVAQDPVLPRAMIWPPSTATAPIGTSPAAAARRASSSAACMKTLS